MAIFGLQLLTTANSPPVAPTISVADGRTVARFTADTTIGSRYQPNVDWDEIVIGADVTLTGSIDIPETRTRPLTIRGENRSTSRLLGTGTYAHIQARDGFARSHSAVNARTRATITIRDLTSRNPDKFHLIARGPMLVERVNLIDNRKAHTTDGVGGGPGTIVRDVLINTFDDALKVYAPDMRFEDVTIIQNRNGAPIQLGWHAEKGSATIRNLTVIANSPAMYNQAIISRAKQSPGSGAIASSIQIDGLRIIVPPGMARPKLLQFGTRSGGVIDGFVITIEGLCSGPAAAFRTRAEIDADTEILNGGRAEIITPDCP